MMNNIQRANRAEEALSQYEENHLPGAVADLLTDLRHLCDLNGWNFEDCVEMSEIHFNCEQDEESIPEND
jgi:hypothetical protein